jgi:uncharacterized protein YoxC
MILELIVGTIALACVILVVFLICIFQDVRRVLKKTDRVLSDLHKTLDAVSEPSAHLIHRLSDLTLDIKKKSEGLNILFHPLYVMSKERAEEKKGHNKLSEIMEFIGEAIRLFGKIKNEIKK